MSGHKKIPDKAIALSGTNIQNIRGATLFHVFRALSGVPTYSRQLTYAHTLWNTRSVLLLCSIPSTAHLRSFKRALRAAIRISCPVLSFARRIPGDPDSLYGALLPLLPSQRFNQIVQQSTQFCQVIFNFFIYPL